LDNARIEMIPLFVLTASLLLFLLAAAFYYLRDFIPSLRIKRAFGRLAIACLAGFLIIFGGVISYGEIPNVNRQVLLARKSVATYGHIIASQAVSFGSVHYTDERRRIYQGFKLTAQWDDGGISRQKTFLDYDDWKIGSPVILYQVPGTDIASRTSDFHFFDLVLLLVGLVMICLGALICKSLFKPRG